MSKTLTAAAIAAVLATPAFAQGWYADVGYQTLGFDEDEIDVDLGAITGHFGYQLNQNFALEGELGVGVKEESFDVLGTDVDVELSYLVGAYVRGQVPVSEQLNLFARVGVVNAELSVEGGGFSESDSETGIGYGAGAEFMFNSTFGIRGDYTRYDIDDAEADAFMIGAVFKY
ncbi:MULTISPECIES: porin family protein [Henriciella]|uniref:porin family protein n=1 Tax=Henriciella TaxID=453849 RepID=UPI0035129ED7